MGEAVESGHALHGPRIPFPIHWKWCRRWKGRWVEVRTRRAAYRGTLVDVSETGVYVQVHEVLTIEEEKRFGGAEPVSRRVNPFLLFIPFAALLALSPLLFSGSGPGPGPAAPYGPGGYGTGYGG
ncbi:MAG: hypothetical protein IRY98_09110, partial [Alicyclobacillaceae bacterium]|nr:hypothetical protein [Alicyclobacillaceae bacterium]